ncbi:MAG: amidohydrolase family protein [Prevotellaceae bacterium]|nr:amidohydrolase family protein [Prevotellaceae bacterium]
MRKVFNSIFIAIALMMVVSCSEVADTVVFGTIRTAETDNPVAEAIAIKDGKFIYVGDKNGAMSFIKEGVTEVIDYTDKGMVMPGCTDGHAHYLSIFALSNQKDPLVIGHDDGKAELLKKLDEAAQKAVANKKHSMFSMGWNYFGIMADKPTLAELDAATHGVSTVLLDATGHHVLCNSECLRRSGILGDDGEVLIKEIEGGLLELDENGYPTGYINERATGYVIRMGGVDPDEIVDDALAETAIIKSQELLLSTGYVSFVEGWSNNYNTPRFYPTAKRLDDEGKLCMLMSMTYEVEPWQKNISEEIDHLASLKKEYGTMHVRPEYLKIFMDGCVENCTGAMSKPYKDGTIYKNFWSVDRLADITRECNSKDLTLHIHSMGDVAIKEVADAYIKGGDGVHRNCIVHLRNPRKEDYKRFADNNIACTGGFTWHVAENGALETLSEFLDEEYVNHSYPIKSFFDAGVKVSSHSDYPANENSPQDPFGIMEVSVSGQMIDPATGAPTVVFDPDELVTLDQVFQALTINGAWQVGLEKERGSIKVGKWADFVLADQDVFKCPVTDIHKTKVVSTYFEGKKVYQAK